MKIEIHPGHLSPQATVDQAKQLITELKAAGWPAELLVEGTAVWDFPNWRDLYKFEKDLEEIRDELWPPYSWIERGPRPEGEIGFGTIDTATIFKCFIDYDAERVNS